MTELFKTKQELQEFLEWAKSKGVFKITVGDLQVEFFHDMLRDIPAPSVPGAPASEPSEGEEGEVTEDELFHSTPG